MSQSPEPELGPEPGMARLRAVLVHLLTALGAIFAMLALVAAAAEDWRLMALWLVGALVVDGIDGPLARRYQVARHAPRLDGVLLDMIIDYLTYVVIPVYALFAARVVDGAMGWAVLMVIPYASALYFADTRMKTADKSFSGFPACWNMVALALLILQPPAWVTLGLLGALTAAMFAPLRFVHPFRTKRWRALSLPVMMGWTGLAGWGAAAGFALPKAAAVAFTAASGYLLLAGIAQQILRPRATA